MHSKQKGNIGFSATVNELHKLRYNVFIEMGDYSRVDIIAEKENKLVKIQVKYATEKEGMAELNLRKCGPNKYNYVYTDKDVDLFSLYLPKLDQVIFIPAKTACKNRNVFRVRFSKSQSNQKKIRRIDEFTNLEKILKHVHNSIR